MIPILYENNETLFASNGIGRLRDCISCQVTEERNGIFECDFDYPVDGARFDDIICGRIVGVTTNDSDWIQPFDIVSYSKPIDGIVSFHCTHISYRLNGITLIANSNINSLDEAFQKFDQAVPTNRFYYWSDFHSTGYMGAADGTPRTIRQLLGGIEGSVLDTYGGEFVWDFWGVKLYKQRGELKDFTIRYGLNMTDYNDETDFSGSYNSCVPYWASGDTIVVGNKTSIGLSQWSGRDICKPLDLTEKFETKPTKTQLNNMAKQILATREPNLPKQTIKVDFINLQDTGEFEQYENLLSCNLCDSIKVVFPRYGMSGVYKIVKTVWDVLGGRYLSLELGSLQTTLSEALGITGESTRGSSNADDYIVETGTDGIWTYRKYASGVSECWGVTSTTSAATISDGGGFRTSPVSADFPSGLFVNNPRVFCSIISGNVVLTPIRLSNGLRTSTGNWAGYRVTQNTDSTTTKYFQFYAIG